MAGKPKLTISEINDRLISRQILLSGTYNNNSTKTSFTCIKCDHCWIAAPKIILRGVGCPNCDLIKRRKSTTKHITNEEIDQKLRIINSDIIRIGEYRRVNQPMDWKCLKCNYIWKTTTTNVLHRKTGCPICGKERTKKILKKDINLITNLLANKQISLLDLNYINSKIPILVQCNKCNYQWYGRIDSMLNGGTGCKKCAIKLISENSIGGYNELLFEHNPEFKYIPSILYLVEIKVDKEHFYKIGITKRSVERRFSGVFDKTEYKIIYNLTMPLYEAFCLEQLMLTEFKSFKYFPNKVFDGRTECVKCVPQVLTFFTTIYELYNTVERRTKIEILY